MADDVDLGSTVSAIRYVPNMQLKAPNDRSTVSELWVPVGISSTLGTSFHVW